MKTEKKDVKFRVKADLALFQAIQKDGRLSEAKIAKMANIPPTTVHYAMKRIKRRDFFEIKGVPRLEKFQEIPTAIIGFTNLDPARIEKLKEELADRHEVVQFFHSDKDVLLFVMDTGMATLAEKLFEIMESLGDKPSIYMVAPKIARYNTGIPNQVLEGVYSALSGR